MVILEAVPEADHVLEGVLDPEVDPGQDLGVDHVQDLEAGNTVQPLADKEAGAEQRVAEGCLLGENCLL